MENIQKLLENASQLVDEAHKLSINIPTEKTSYLLWLITLARSVGISSTIVRLKIDPYDYVCEVTISETDFGLELERSRRFWNGRGHERIEENFRFHNKIKEFLTDMENGGVATTLLNGICRSLTEQILNDLKEWSSGVNQYRTLLSQLPNI